MRTLVLLPLLLPTIARADAVAPVTTERAGLTSVQRGVWHLDVGSLGVVTTDHVDQETTTQLAFDSSVALSYFVRDNVAVGFAAIAGYAHSTDGGSDLTLGGAVVGSVHVRLGYSAFLRPSFALGGLVGQRTLPSDGPMSVTVDQVGGILRIGLPVAYYIGRRFALQAGPAIDVTLGSFGGDDETEGTTFVRVAGGFAIGLGYAF